MGYNIDVTNNFYEEKLFGGQNWSPSLANTPKNTKNILKTMAKSSIIKKIVDLCKLGQNRPGLKKECFRLNKLPPLTAVVPMVQTITRTRTQKRKSLQQHKILPFCPGE